MEEKKEHDQSDVAIPIVVIFGVIDCKHMIVEEYFKQNREKITNIYDCEPGKVLCLTDNIEETNEDRSIFEKWTTNDKDRRDIADKMALLHGKDRKQEHKKRSQPYRPRMCMYEVMYHRLNGMFNTSILRDGMKSSIFQSFLDALHCGAGLFTTDNVECIKQLEAWSNIVQGVRIVTIECKRKTQVHEQESQKEDILQRLRAEFSHL